MNFEKNIQGVPRLRYILKVYSLGNFKSKISYTQCSKSIIELVIGDIIFNRAGHDNTFLLIN